MSDTTHDTEHLKRVSKAESLSCNTSSASLRPRGFMPVVEVSGEPHAPEKEARSPQRTNREHPGGVNRPPVPETARRDAVRRTVLRAVTQAEEMRAAASIADLMALSNAGFSLKNSLDELWSLRRDREEKWADLLNLLQGALAGEDFESFTEVQCAAIKSVLDEHLRPWTIDDDDIRVSLRILRRGGFDPWKSISATSGDQ